MIEISESVVAEQNRAAESALTAAVTRRSTEVAKAAGLVIGGVATLWAAGVDPVAVEPEVA